jgi:hypothetical protein
MSRSKPFEIFHPGIIDGFLDTPIRLEHIEITMAALAKEVPDAVYDEKKARGWLEIPDGKVNRAYTPREKERIIDAEIRDVGLALTEDVLPRGDGRPEMAITFGSHGTGKTWLAYTLAGDTSVMVDIQEVQQHLGLYQDAMKRYGNEGILGAVTAQAYGHWAASYVGKKMVNDLLPDYDVIYSSTGTYDSVLSLYDRAEATGVSMPLHMIVAPEAVRTESARKRWEGPEALRAESTRKRWEGPEGDRMPMPRSQVIEQNQKFGRMIQPHFARAATASLYWRDEVDAAPQEIATARGGHVLPFRLTKEAQKAMSAEIRSYKPDFDWQKEIVQAHAAAHAKKTGGSSVRHYLL